MANEVRLIDANVMPKGQFWEGLTDKEKAKVLAYLVMSPTVDAVVLPVKIGDSLWCVYSPPRPANPADKGKWYMGEFEVARFHYGIKGLSVEMYGFGTVSVKEIGKNIFLTREEAEKALAKIGGDEDGKTD